MKFGILEIKKSISVISIIKIGIDPMPTTSKKVAKIPAKKIKNNLKICLLLKSIFNSL
jgi:hypothetical protein